MLVDEMSGNEREVVGGQKENGGNNKPVGNSAQS
jgi:hypothetical protein